MEVEIFNTLKYTKILEEVGVSREQAEIHVQIIAEIVEDNLATKQDIKDLRNDTRQDIKDLKDEMQKLEYRLTIKLSAIVGTIVTIAIAIVTAVSKFH